MLAIDLLGERRWRGVERRHTKATVQITMKVDTETRKKLKIVITDDMAYDA